MTNGSARFGRKIIGYTPDGKQVYANDLSSEAFGEILLQKDPADGICNICLKEFSALSEEHVPPKCTGNRGRYRFISYLNFMTDSSTKPLGFSQNGIKYRTVCTECNNITLKHCDDAISELFNPSWMTTFRKSNLVSHIVRTLSLGGYSDIFFQQKLPMYDRQLRTCSYELCRTCQTPSRSSLDSMYFLIRFRKFELSEICCWW